MSHAKARSRTQAVTILGVAGALSLAANASWATVGLASNTPTETAVPIITLTEEEISDVSPATFYIFDNENAGAQRPRLQLARQRGHGGSAVYRGSGGYGGYGGYGGSGSYGGGGGPTGAGGPDGM
jgi:hypothetical protein